MEWFLQNLAGIIKVNQSRRICCSWFVLVQSRNTDKTYTISVSQSRDRFNKHHSYDWYISGNFDRAYAPFLRVKGNYLISKTEGRGLFEAMSKCALEHTEVEKIKGNDLVNNTHDFIRKQEVGSV